MEVPSGRMVDVGDVWYGLVIRLMWGLVRVLLVLLPAHITPTLLKHYPPIPNLIIHHGFSSNNRVTPSGVERLGLVGIEGWI